MKDEIIEFPTAQLAKEKEFDILNSLIGSNHSFYKNDGSRIVGDSFAKQLLYYAPTQSLLQKWLREVHQIDVIPTFSEFSRTYGYKIFHIESGKTICINNMYIKKSIYEEAFEEGLVEGLKLVKKS